MFFKRLVVQVEVLQANYYWGMLQYPWRVLLDSGMTITASYCLPLNFYSIYFSESALFRFQALISYSSQVFFSVLLSLLSKSFFPSCPNTLLSLAAPSAEIMRALRDLESTLCLITLLNLMDQPVNFCFQSNIRNGCFDAIIINLLFWSLIISARVRKGSKYIILEYLIGFWAICWVYLQHILYCLDCKWNQLRFQRSSSQQSLKIKPFDILNPIIPNNTWIKPTHLYYLSLRLLIRSIRHQCLLLGQELSHNKPTHPDIYFTGKCRSSEHYFWGIVAFCSESFCYELMDALDIGQTKIEQLCSIFCNQDIRFFEVSMDYTMFMTIIQSFQNIPDICQARYRIQIGHDMSQGHSMQILKQKTI